MIVKVDVDDDNEAHLDNVLQIDVVTMPVTCVVVDDDEVDDYCVCVCVCVFESDVKVFLEVVDVDACK